MELSKSMPNISWVVNQRFKLGKRLGSGTCATVFEATDLVTGKLYAVKVQERFSKRTHASLEREAFAMVANTHRNVPAVYDVCKDENYVYLVEELCQGGDLLELVQREKRVSEKVAGNLFAQLCQVINNVHMSGYIHRDIKLENILLDKDGDRVVLCDWGFATQWHPSRTHSRACGSFHYASPEVWHGLPYVGPEVDIWGMGVCLYMLVTGKFPFFGRTHEDIARRVLRPRSYARPEYLSSSVLDLIDRMLCVDVNNRATLSEVMSHPWFCKFSPISPLVYTHEVDCVDDEYAEPLECEKDMVMEKRRTRIRNRRRARRNDQCLTYTEGANEVGERRFMVTGDDSLQKSKSETVPTQHSEEDLSSDESKKDFVELSSPLQQEAQERDHQEQRRSRRTGRLWKAVMKDFPKLRKARVASSGSLEKKDSKNKRNMKSHKRRLAKIDDFLIRSISV